MTPTRYHITTQEEYDYCLSRGLEPLADKRFSMDISLRRKIQKQKFGGNTMEGNAIFYRFCWAHRIHVCEECGAPLEDFSPTFISHILTRGAHAEMAHDIRNINILCFKHHNQWEHATTRAGMRILKKNLRTIEELKREYASEAKGVGEI